MASIPGQPQ